MRHKRSLGSLFNPRSKGQTVIRWMTSGPGAGLWILTLIAALLVSIAAPAALA